LTRIEGVEADYERFVRTAAPEFRLVTEVETFDALSGPTETVVFNLSEKDISRISRPNSPPVIITLHDYFNGQPLANCVAPCSLQAPARRPSIVNIYRYGSKPMHYPAIAYFESENPRPVYLPFNEVDHQLERERCAIEFKQIQKTEPVRDAQPCVRVPPFMPSEATRSGYCMVTFNVNRRGETTDVQTQVCTDQVFCEPTTEATTRWIYYPKIDYGEVVERPGVESKMSFRLTNEHGQIIPEPDDIMQPCTGSV
jgi:hypothetical protein